MRYLMTFSYDGTLFKGYQKQVKERTVQGELEQALAKINNRPVKVVASGRTDAKVHALNQTAHFDLDIKIAVDRLKKAINSLIGNDIYVKKIEVVPNDFHARFEVKSKEYVYRLNMGEYNPLERDYVYQYNKLLDVKAMEEACQYLIGPHNFKAFAKTDNDKEDYGRIITDIGITVKGPYLEISFVGTGFFRYMVRNMVGTIIEVGAGKRKSNDVERIINSLDRKEAGKTAPPEGLYLKKVNY